MKKSLAVFVSGFGSNLQVFIDQKQVWDKLLVISSKADAQAVSRAKEAELPVEVLEKSIDWEKLHQTLLENKIDLVFLAGFMRIVPGEFISKWEGKMFNLHPSMLPKYKGLKAIEQAFEAQDDVGVSIHHVVPEVDSGEIVLQEVAVTGAEAMSLTLENVKEMTHNKEHQLVSQWIEKYGN